jgi:hypothetical protein
MALLGDETGPVAARREQSGLKGKWARATTSSSIAAEHMRAEEGLRAQKAADMALQELEKRSPGWVKYFDQFFPIAVNLGLGYSTASAPENVMQAVALGLSVGNDLVGLGNEALDMKGFYSLSEEISNLANAPDDVAISAPVLTSTTADFGPMKLQPIGGPPQRPAQPLPPTAPVRPTKPLPPIAVARPKPLPPIPKKS